VNHHIKQQHQQHQQHQQQPLIVNVGASRDSQWSSCGHSARKFNAELSATTNPAMTSDLISISTPTISIESETSSSLGGPDYDDLWMDGLFELNESSLDSCFDW
jgi:hypothetical protein